MGDREAGNPGVAAIVYVEAKPEDKERPQLGIAVDSRHMQLGIAGIAALKAAPGEEQGVVDAAIPRWEREAEARKRDLALYLTSRVERLEAEVLELHRLVASLETQMRGREY